MRMKIQPPNLTEPLEGGNLLYDLVQMQQQDEEELRGGIYRNQLLEGFDGSGIEFKKTNGSRDGTPSGFCRHIR